MTEYSYPVSQLLTLGEEPARLSPWPDYLALGFQLEHVPDLIRMVFDEDLYLNMDYDDEVFAQIHAWRVLGQLKAEAAIEPLLELMIKNSNFDLESDWESSELPDVLAMIPTIQLSLIADKLADKTLEMWPRSILVETLYKIGQNQPEKRTECIQILTNQLSQFAEQDITLNAFVMGGLYELRAVEALPLIEQVFAANRIDTSIYGDWEDVQIHLGLLAERTKSREISPQVAEMRKMMSQVKPNLQKLASSSKPTNVPKKSQDKVRAAKRKQERQARKKNRRK